MISWLQSILGTIPTDLTFLLYLTACVIAVLIVVLVSSMLFGIATNIFRK